MKKFHITIRDNETGETLHDCDTNAIIGAFQASDDATAAIGITHCNALDLLAVTTAAKKAADKIVKNNPILALFEAITDRVLATEDTEDTEDTENTENN